MESESSADRLHRCLSGHSCKNTKILQNQNLSSKMDVNIKLREKREVNWQGEKTNVLSAICGTQRGKIYYLNSYATVMNFIPYTLEDVLYS